MQIPDLCNRCFNDYCACVSCQRTNSEKTCYESCRWDSMKTFCGAFKTVERMVCPYDKPKS